MIRLTLLLSLLFAGSGWHQRSYFGDWYFAAIIHERTPAALTETEARRLLGTRIHYENDLVTGGGGSCGHPEYRETTYSEDEFLAHARISAKDLGVTSHTVTMVEVLDSAGRLWYGPGALFIVKEPDSMIGLWQGVYFEMKRVRH